MQLTPDFTLQVNEGGTRVLGCLAHTEKGKAWLALVPPFPPEGYDYMRLLGYVGGLQSFGTMAFAVQFPDET